MKTQIKALASWKTTLMGVSGALTALGMAAKGLSDGDVELAMQSTGGFIVAMGLIFARDNDKSSQDVGCRK
jgi:hypothetical protein